MPYQGDEHGARHRTVFGAAAAAVGIGVALVLNADVATALGLLRAGAGAILAASGVYGLVRYWRSL